jgi:hypothetical protein
MELFSIILVLEGIASFLFGAMVFMSPKEMTQLYLGSECTAEVRHLSTTYRVAAAPMKVLGRWNHFCVFFCNSNFDFVHFLPCLSNTVVYHSLLPCPLLCCHDYWIWPLQPGCCLHRQENCMCITPSSFIFFWKVYASCEFLHMCGSCMYVCLNSIQTKGIVIAVDCCLALIMVVTRVIHNNGHPDFWDLLFFSAGVGYMIIVLIILQKKDEKDEKKDKKE